MNEKFNELMEMLLSIDGKHFTWNDAKEDVLDQLHNLQSDAEIQHQRCCSNSSEEIVKFFDDNLQIFRQNVKDAKSANEQDIHIRFSDATSYLKQMWLDKNG